MSKAILTLHAKQHYPDTQAETMEFVTEGELLRRDGGWDISYEESELTGLNGVRTLFRVEPEQVTLQRSGALSSEMVFREGVVHESLYRMEFGALLMTVCAKRICAQLDETGGTVDLTYAIEIERGGAGIVEYHLDIRTLA